jgi:uncharacterized SAM-dependent methyltransferase
MRKVQLISDSDLERDLLENLRNLQLPDYLLYSGTDGANGWLELDRSNSFTIASELTSLLEKNLPALNPVIKKNIHLISIGVGGAQKEELLLSKYFGRFAHFFAIDISSGMVDSALDRLEKYGVEITGIIGLFEDLEILSSFWCSPALICFLGNSFSSYEANYALGLLSKNIHLVDYLLLDFHLLRTDNGFGSETQIENAYRSAENVAFNFGPFISRGVEPDCLEFRLDLVLTGTPVGMAYRTRRAVNVLKNFSIVFSSGSVAFEEGERIELGFTYKYTAEQVRALLSLNGFKIVNEWLESGGSGMLALIKKE